MPGRGAWRVRVGSREFEVTIVGVPRSAPLPAASRLLSEILFSARSRGSEAARAVAEISQALRGTDGTSFGASRSTVGSVVLDGVDGELETALRGGELVVREVGPPPPARLLVEEEEPAPEPPVEETPDTTFIIINVRDDRDKPIVCRFQVKLPNGEVREYSTGADGRYRVEDIVGGGSASITFPDLDEQAVSPGKAAA